MYYRQVDARLDCRASQRCPVSRRPMVGASCARSMCYQITNKHWAILFHSACVRRRMPDLIDISTRTSAPHRSQVCTKKSPWRSARRSRGRPERRCRPSTFCVTTKCTRPARTRAASVRCEAVGSHCEKGRTERVDARQERAADSEEAENLESEDLASKASSCVTKGGGSLRFEKSTVERGKKS